MIPVREANTHNDALSPRNCAFISAWGDQWLKHEYSVFARTLFRLMPPRPWHIEVERTCCASRNIYHGLAKPAQFSLTFCDAFCASGISEFSRSSPFLMMASHGGKSLTVNLCSNSYMYTAASPHVLVAASPMHYLGWFQANSSQLRGGSTPKHGMRIMLMRPSVS